jgi:hypothetical protein
MIRARRRRPTTTTALAAILALMLAMVLGAPAGAATKPLTATISPNGASAGSTQAFTLTLSNNSSTTTIGSVNVKSSNGFTFLTASAPSGTATIVKNLVQLRNLGFTPGTQIAVQIEAVAPCAAGSYRWSASAKVSPNFGGPVFASASPGPVLVAGACSLAFVQQPAPANVGQVITGTPFDTAGPPLTVAVLDNEGAVSDTSTAAVTMSIGTNPQSGSLQGTKTVTAQNGTATFGDLSIDTHGLGYTLVATSGLATTTSNPFDVTDAGSSTCTGSCTVNSSLGITSTSVTSTNTGPGDTLFVVVGVEDLDCPGFTETSDVVTFGSTGTGFLTVTITVAMEEPVTQPLLVCYGAGDGKTFTDINGELVNQGLLAPCDIARPVPPCMVSGTRGDGSKTLKFLAPEGDPKGRV